MLFSITFCRFRHIRHLQIFNVHNRVVFADLAADLMQVVFTDIADFMVQFGNFGF